MARFTPGHTLLHELTCSDCHQPYQAKTTTSKYCPACRVGTCLHCGLPTKKREAKLCSLKCTARYKVRTNPDVLVTLQRGRALAHGELDQQRREKIRKARTGVPRHDIRGANNPRWKGGSGSERHQAMGRLEYKVWRATVYKRDGYACVLCAATKTRFEAHHIHRWSTHPEIRYEPANGVTLCTGCHDRIVGCEEQFVERFTAYVATRAPVGLTDAERTRFARFEVPCSQCGKTLEREPHMRSKRWHFCDANCKRTYSTTIGHNWRGVAASAVRPLTSDTPPDPAS